MAGEVTSAWIAAGASLLVSVVSFGTAIWSNRRSAELERRQTTANENLARLNSRLSAENDAAKAKRDYEYDALKRLYTDLYPLAYQLQEGALGASSRIVNLALATREGFLNLGPDNWLTGGDPYYLNVLIHSLVAPLAVYELMTRKLTQLDLKLDPDLQRQHFIARMAYRAFRSDFDFADAKRYPPIEFDTGKLAYHPPEQAPAAMPAAPEQRWSWRQGLYSGQISQAVDVLVIGEDSGSGAAQTKRVMTFAEFAKALGGTDLRKAAVPHGKPGAMKQALQPIVEVFRDFHPARRPATWRILMAQAVCYRAISAMSRGLRSNDQIIPAACITGDKESLADFSWIGNGSLLSKQDLPIRVDMAAEHRNALDIAETYFKSGLQDFARQYPARTPGERQPAQA